MSKINWNYEVHRLFGARIVLGENYKTIVEALLLISKVLKEDNKKILKISVSEVE